MPKIFNNIALLKKHDKVYNPFLQLSLLQLTLVIAFGAALASQLCYFAVIYLQVPRKAKRGNRSERKKQPPVSIVVCARNEEENLNKHLPLLLEQKYPNYEVVVVDDCSEDNTGLILGKFKEKYKHLKVTFIKKDLKFSHGKKLALTVGVKAAKHDWLLLTDADCAPASEEWLATMASNFEQPTEVVLGYGGYKTYKGLLNKFIRLDTLMVALNYLGFAYIKSPYMGVGRNLAYRKDLFFKNRGFASFNHLDSGDDDLFVQAVANGQNTKVEIRKPAHTLSEPSKNFADWFTQKSRHLTTSTHYKKGLKFWLLFEPLSRILFWGLGVALLFLFPEPLIIGGAIFLRLIILLTIIKIASSKLGEQKLLLPSLGYDVLSPFFYFIIIIYNKIKTNKKKWI